jgi:hypothetical protein
MSTMSTTGLYEQDLYGTNPKNLIDDEIQTLQVPGPDDYYFIIPKAAPFFADSVKVFNAQTGAEYKVNEDYMLGHYFIEAMDSIGRPICGSISFMKRTIQGQVRLVYRTIGGPWGFSDTEILAELSNRQLNPLVRWWGQIGPLPYAFPPLEHDQPINSLVGSKEVRDAIDRLAAVIEANAEGTSQSHITNYNNPHRTTKNHVGLGLVANFAMATDAEALAGVRTDLYLSPGGASLLINRLAVTPMNAHINARGNVHGMTAADINLGNVPNYPAATPQQAIDTTNATTLLTPYSATLLIQSLSNSQQVQDLANRLNAHLQDFLNPHKVTPAGIGTYSKVEIDEIVRGIVAGGGGDAATFGGKTPGEWEDMFVLSTEADSLLTKLITQYETNTATLLAVTVEDPTDPNVEINRRNRLVAAAYGGYECYSLVSPLQTAKFVEAEGTNIYPQLMTDSVDRWFGRKDADYYIAANGAAHAVGTGAIQAPVGWKDDVSFNPANRMGRIWATKDRVFASKYVAPSGGAEVPMGDLWVWSAATGANPPSVLVPSSVGAVMVITNSQLTIPDENAFIEAPAGTFYAIGHADWVTKSNAAIANARTRLVGDTLNSATILDNHIVFMGDKVGSVLVYDIVRNAGVYTITFNSTAEWRDASGPVDLRTLGAPLTLYGRYNHAVLYTADNKVVCFGSNDNGQCEVDNDRGPFLSGAAGNNFTVTVNTRNEVMFWGDSPDNSMLYIGGSKYVEETTP